MSRGLARLAGSLTALAAALLLAAPVSPAAAAEGGPRITLDSPRAEPPLTGASFTVSGRADVESLSIYRMREVTVSVGGDSETFPCSESPCRFSMAVTRERNGPYKVDVTARQTAILLGSSGPSGELSRTFSVAAPPRKPTLDPPRVTNERTVELSWSRNTEADMLYYAVFRKDPGSSKLFEVGRVDQPRTGTKVPFTDRTTADLAGGDVAYQVVAVRMGATGTDDSEIPSDPSGSATATVPAPPTTTTVAPAPGAPAGGPTTTAKPGPPAGVDLSGFLSARSAPVNLPAITIPEPPDTGFTGTLPFGSFPAGEELEEGEAEAVPPNDVQRRRTSFVTLDSGRPLVPVAAGLVLLLLALHLRLLNRRIKQPVADGDLPVDVPAPAPAPAAGQARIRVEALEREDPVELAVEDDEREAEPVPAPPGPQPTALFDVAEEEDWDARWDEEWAPEPVDLEPEPEPDLQPAPEPEPEVDFDLERELKPEPEPELPEPEPEVEVVALWAPEPELQPEPEATTPGEEEIEVFEVVSPTRRRLARAGSR